jgi:hypothetical protein
MSRSTRKRQSNRIALIALILVTALASAPTVFVTLRDGPGAVPTAAQLAANETARQSHQYYVAGLP